MIDLRLVRHHEIPPALFGDVLPVLDALAEADQAIAVSAAVIGRLADDMRGAL